MQMNQRCYIAFAIITLLIKVDLSHGSVEWCSSKLSLGTFQQTSDCLVTETTIVNSGKLNITGVENSELLSGIPRIFRTGHDRFKFRFFTVIGDGELELEKLVLTGGNVEYHIGSEYSWGGGAIYVSGPNTKLNILDSIFYDNRAYAGGSIFASNETNVVVENTKMGGITTTNTGGALWCGFINTTCTIKGSSTRVLYYRFRLTRKQITTMYPDLNDESVACPFHSNCIFES